MLSVGAVGYRNHAGKIISLIERSGLAKVVAIFHPHKCGFDPRATKDLTELDGLDAIFILSPNDTHLLYLERLANYRGYVFCEKPPVARRQDLNRLTALALDTDRFFFNFNYRFGRFRAAVDEGVASGALGRPLQLSVVMSHGLAFKPEYAGSWRADAKRHLHGVTETKGIHYIDLANSLFGKPVRWVYAPSNVSGCGTAYDTAHLSLLYPQGEVATILVSYAAPLAVQSQVIGTNGMIEYRDGRLTLTSPRDTFDSHGYFAAPPTKVLFDYCGTATDMAEESLQNSLAYFLVHCRDRMPFHCNLFETSLATNRLLLELVD